MRSVTATLAWLMVEVLVISEHAVKELHIAGKTININVYVEFDRLQDTG